MTHLALYNYKPEKQTNNQDKRIIKAFDVNNWL